MPLLMPTDELQPGMKLAEPVFADGLAMMQTGRPLTPTDVDVLQRRFPGRLVRIEDAVLDSVVAFEDDSQEREIAAVAQRRVAKCVARVGRRFAARAVLEEADLNAIHATVQELIAHMERNRATAALIAQCMDTETFLGSHTGNVFYLSMLLGSAVLHLIAAERKRAAWARDVQRDFAHDLTPLGLAALVLDVALLPHQQLLRKKGFLTPEEYETLQTHPLVGADLLPRGFNGIARLVVRTHHEDFQGMGYPQQLPRDRLHIFARIVRIADAFDAATSHQTFSGAKSPARALWEMSMGPHCHCYDPELMKAFCKLIQPFPIGAKLRMTDGCYAVVVKYNRRQPFDPMVVIACDAEGRTLPKEKLEEPFELSSREGLRIASLYDEDLSFIYGPSAEGTPEEERSATVFDMFYP